MWPFRKKEQRAEMVEFEDALLKALLNGNGANRKMALQVPTVAGGISLIADIVAGTPIKLYIDEKGSRAREVTDDPRLRLLNDETGDTLNANDFWHAMVRDYYLGRGGYAYINRHHGKVISLHYVREDHISILKNTDPIFKDFSIQVDGRIYAPWDFLKLLRATTDGMEGVPITQENSKLIEAAYATLVFERNLARQGGNKRGFLRAEKRLDQESLNALRDAFSRLYSEGGENFVLLNNGIDFKESGATSVEMQLNENKQTNAAEFARLFHVSPQAIAGTASEQDIASIARLAAIPLMTAIQCALNRDLLLEEEKDRYYFAFDTKELLKGDMQGRFNAYKTALDANFMQIDEVRYAEDLAPLGLTWIKLGLQDVLYDPDTKEIFTPNTGRRQLMEAIPAENMPDGLPEDAEAGTMEERGRYYVRDSKGRFAGSGGGGGSRRKRKTKYAPSPRRNPGGISLHPKRYARLCGTLGTKYPGLKPEDGVRTIYDANYCYDVTADGFGGMTVHSVTKIGKGG